jgi:hypothetical protein
VPNFATTIFVAEVIVMSSLREASLSCCAAEGDAHRKGEDARPSEGGMTSPFPSLGGVGAGVGHSPQRGQKRSPPTEVTPASSAAQEIARSVQSVAQGTHEAAANIMQVNRGATQTGSASEEVLNSAKSLSSESARLREELNRFMANIRAA